MAKTKFGIFSLIAAQQLALFFLRSGAALFFSGVYTGAQLIFILFDQLQSLPNAVF